MTPKTRQHSAPSHFRRILLAPLGLALLLAAIDWGFRGHWQDWLQRRMETADGWLLSVFTADIHRNGGSNQAIPPKTVTPVTNADVWEISVEPANLANFPEAQNASQQSVADTAASISADLEQISTVTSTEATHLLRTALARSGTANGKQQICRVVLTGIALTGQRQADGSWQLQPGNLQQNLVIPDPDGALHPAGLLNGTATESQDNSEWFKGKMWIEPRPDGVTIVWSDGSGDPVTARRMQAELITGTLEDVSSGLPLELKPDLASASFLQELLADNLRPQLAEQLGDGLEADDIDAELTSPGRTRITIDGSVMSWSFVSSATVRLQRATAQPLRSATSLTK
ncbi:MAG: hypothetical protein ACKO2L_13225 [Planctomycetaceae bacterium]